MVSFASFEDYLYVIFGILWVVFSIYNANRKKKAKEAKAKGDNSESKSVGSSILDAIMKEVGVSAEDLSPNQSDPYTNTPKTVSTQEEQNKYEEEADVESDNVFSYDDIYEESNYSPPTNVIDRKQQVKLNKTATGIVKSNNPSEKRKAKKINLRKAVIYSEILKKKNF